MTRASGAVFPRLSHRIADTPIGPFVIFYNSERKKKDKRLADDVTLQSERVSLKRRFARARGVACKGAEAVSADGSTGIWRGRDAEEERNFDKLPSHEARPEFESQESRGPHTVTDEPAPKGRQVIFTRCTRRHFRIDPDELLLKSTCDFRRRASGRRGPEGRTEEKNTKHVWRENN
ncbi:hypothetical protein IRJ41_012545 [Triplophysa rosa]|uniref:Uncharacterized protein n=1 Tax=Triplophysa rosa TaxID=992332 RepID=A0A9W7THN3_TRIRA|nr:hypothetical protein IRJ41_012545 [Triplophysa rosa]